mgnify:CR=1 FL=1
MAINTVNSAGIADGSIVNADVKTDADIAGSKLAADSIAESKLDIHNAPSGTDKYLGYTSNGMEWVTVDAGAKGGGTNKIFWENEQTIDYNYTITNNHNAGTFGPVTIAATGNGDGSAVTVTIGDGETWTII